jgi:hypothetical protein
MMMRLLLVAGVMMWSGSAAAQALPTWTYTVLSARDGLTHSGSMVGASPFTSPGASTSVPAQIVPLILRMEDGTTFDPTSQPAPCAQAPFTSTPELTLFQASPLFQNHAWVLNGVDVGSTQFGDAFQRANFWSLVRGQNYHVLLGPVTTLPPVTVPVPASVVTSHNQGCGSGVFIDMTWMKNYIEGTLIPPLAAQGVGPATLPIVFWSGLVYAYGFHAAFGTPQQTYVAGSAGPMSHEIAEWMDDPFATNVVADWGFVGQFPNSCSPALEVADAPGRYNEGPTMPNGYTYWLPELAYFSWFMGAPSLAAAGAFSSNGTFKGPAAPCPPGGSLPAPVPAAPSAPTNLRIVQ